MEEAAGVGTTLGALEALDEAGITPEIRHLILDDEGAFDDLDLEQIVKNCVFVGALGAATYALGKVRAGKSSKTDLEDEVTNTTNNNTSSNDEVVVNESEGGSSFDLEGVRIINKKYAGKTFKLSGELGEKYPEGVSFSNEGFPDFEPYSIKKVTINNLEGDTYYDFIKANEAAGYLSTPKGYTWHHVEDGKTMLLVPCDLHSAVRHTGGASLIRKGIRP